MIMFENLSKLLDRFSDFLAARKGLLPMIGIFLVVVNFIIRLSPPSWLSKTDLLLHLGVILCILGIMLAWAL
jgi:hypothetical protein